ncbi:MAG: UDP-3-O-acyl-N-acetylglucosamine deacetylase [Pseudomonadota bacterium]
MRFTLANTAEFTGVGLHSGRPVTARVLPAMPGVGIVFERTDAALGTGRVPARFDLVTDTRLCTRLENAHGVTVGTVEHLMAALAGCGIADARIVLDGPEVPIMDGSSRIFVQGFARAGVVATGPAPKRLRVLRKIEVVDGDKRASLLPAQEGQKGLTIRFSIDFDDPAIGRQSHALALTGSRFAEELADCRTFGHFSEVEQLRKLGLARGGSLENAIVVDKGRVMNPGGLRRRDEFVRHKILDAVGDLALAGMPITGVYEGVKAGHGLTNELLRALFAETDAWELVDEPSAVTALPAAPRQGRTGERRRVAV